ncbi:MAG: tetrapyrrole methylase [Proteobacteria bacterium]|nr:tetrapyrrole methylase [Pseudomonadota bacterium]
MPTPLGSKREESGERPTSGSPNFHHGFFYLIGCGPNGPQTATLQALETIQRMDAVLAPARQARLFADYIGDTPVAFDPWAGFWDYQGKPFNTLTPEETELFRQNRTGLLEQRMEEIRAMLDKGLDVGLLEFGNPCLFGPGQSYAERLRPQEVIIIPGMGADAAAMAAVGASILPAHQARFLLQTAPFMLTGQGLSPDMSLEEPSPEAQEFLSLLAKQQHSAIFYMALADAPRLFEMLGRDLPGDLPCAAVYWAGDPERQRVVRGVLEDMPAKLKDDPERFMGLLLVGRFLEGQPFTTAHDRSPAMAEATQKKN